MKCEHGIERGDHERTCTRCYSDGSKSRGSEEKNWFFEQASKGLFAVDVFAKVRSERIRQDRKWGEQNHTPMKWLAILGEEIGEANKAILENSLMRYNDELIQVAAVAVSAVESLARNCKRDCGDVVKNDLRPIETAPKDGTYVLLFGDSGYIGTPLRCEVCKYDAEFRPKQPWVNHAGNSFLDGGAFARFWMPLPEVPND